MRKEEADRKGTAKESNSDVTTQTLKECCGKAHHRPAVSRKGEHCSAIEDGREQGKETEKSDGLRSLWCNREERMEPVGQRGR